MGCLQCPTLSSKHFICVYVFIPYNNLEIQFYYLHFTDEKSEVE